jgi:L-ascorbate metabolism protein UlaG (beta-lactamase superfamily)
MDIIWYGHSCFRLTERGSATVVTDPFDHQVTGYEPLKLTAGVVTISHEAPGHNYESAVKGKYHLIKGPGEYEIGGVFITGVQTNGKRKRETGEPRNTLYVFDYDGVTVAHLGDLRHVPNQTEIEALGNVHVALVPVGGGGGLAPARAVEVVSLLEPGIVIPMHYGTPACSINLLPVSKFLKEMGVANVESQASLKVTRSTVPGQTRVVVLDYKQK